MGTFMHRMRYPTSPVARNRYQTLRDSALLFAYAVYRVDWVMMAAFAFNPIPYVRNLVLLSRERDAARA